MLKHWRALLLLELLDFQVRFRRTLNRTFLRLVLLAFAAGLLLIVVSSVLAMRRISQSVESLIGDSLVGLETSVTMRALVRESETNLLRYPLQSTNQTNPYHAGQFKKHIAELQRIYRKNLYDPNDLNNLVLIESKALDYTRVLEAIAGDKPPSTEEILQADNAARELVDAVEVAYEFNRQRVRVSAAEAQDSAKQVLSIAGRLVWSFSVFIALVVAIFALDRWIAVPDEQG